MAKTIVTLAAVVGFISAAVGLIQVFSFHQLPVVVCHHYPNDAGEDTSSTMLPCLRDLQNNVDETVLLDWATYTGDNFVNEFNVPMGKPFGRQRDGESLTFGFDYCTFAWELGSRCDRVSHDQITEVFSDGTISADASGLSDNGFAVEIFGDRAGISPLTNVQWEAQVELAPTLDIASGPFRVTRLSGHSRTYRLSPAPMTDVLERQVRCARRDWPPIAKFLLCPFQ